MNIGPILRRELVEFARQPGMRLLRVAAAALVIFVCWRAASENAWLLQGSGRPLFQGLNKLLFLIIWLLGPLMTADCLSSEKREGTIGLLFLTPLRPGEVVAGKVFVHALRGFSVIVAAFPILVLPILVGGVTLADGVRMLMFHLSALGLALTSGVLASAVSTRAASARMLALVLTASVGSLFALLYLTVTVVSVWRSVPAAAASQVTFSQIWLGNLNMLLRTYGPSGAAYNPYGRWGFGGGATWGQVGYAAVIAAGSALMVAAAGWFAARGLKKTWRSEDKEPRPSLLEALPVLLPVLRTRNDSKGRRSLLDHNPLRWLETRARTPLTWIVLGCATGLLSYGWLGLIPLSLSHLFLAAVFAMLGASVLKREKEDGRFEMLAVTPLPPGIWYWERFRQTLLAALLAGGITFAINYAGVLQSAQRVGLTGQTDMAQEGAIAGASTLIWLIATVSVAFAGCASKRTILISAAFALAIRHAGIDLVPWALGFAFRTLPILYLVNQIVTPAVVIYFALRLASRQLKRI